MADQRKRVLILDDEESIIQALGKLLMNQGLHITACLHPTEAVRRLENDGFDLVISDLKMPRLTGIEFLALVQEKCPHAGRILLTEPQDREMAVAAINRGTADWFLDKPWDEEILNITIKTALRFRGVLLENRKLLEILQDAKEASKGGVS
jgi:DNA-binding NtrC family response regulator